MNMDFITISISPSILNDMFSEFPNLTRSAAGELKMYYFRTTYDMVKSLKIHYNKYKEILNDTKIILRNNLLENGYYFEFVPKDFKEENCTDYITDYSIFENN
ncbi:MAG: hypothetical protein EOL97_15835 [Spirochaetia bacterium]|nr:hypothetical protein [Spirochaetia bacterium]